MDEATEITYTQLVDDLEEGFEFASVLSNIFTSYAQFADYFGNVAEWQSLYEQWQGFGSPELGAENWDQFVSVANAYRVEATV